MLNSVPQLEAYYWVARTGTFGAAADRLRLTQPAVSVRVRELERDVGEPLFLRTRRGVRLTPRGREIFDQVEQILGLLAEVASGGGTPGRLRATLRLGVPDSFALCCMSNLIDLATEEHPDTTLAITVDNSRALAQRLGDALLDAAILAQPEPSADTHLELLGEQQVAWVCSPHFRPASDALHPADLSRALIITNPAPSPTYRILMEWFAEGGVIPSRLVTCTSMAAITEAAKRSGAVCVVPVCTVREAVADGTLAILRVEPGLPSQRVFLGSPARTAHRTGRLLADLIRRAVAGTGFVELAPASYGLPLPEKAARDGAPELLSPKRQAAARCRS